MYSIIQTNLLTLHSTKYVKHHRQVWGGIIGEEGLKEPGTADFYSAFYNDHVSEQEKANTG